MKAVIGYQFSVTRAASRRGTANSWFARARLAIFIAALLLLPTAVHALAIAPGQAETSFTPGEQKNFDFELINNEGMPANIELYARGALAEFVSFAEPTKFTMQPHESKKINFGVNFPSSAKLPDIISIISKTAARSSTGNNVITAKVALEFKLRIIAPQSQQQALVTGKAAGIPDAKASFSAAEVEIIDVRFENVGKETAKLIIDAKNTGTTDIDVSAEANFGSGATRRLAKAGSVKIAGGATRRLAAQIDIRGVPQGSYDAEVLLKYADKIKRQVVKLQVIEAGYFNSPAYVYIILGALIAFNIVFVMLLAGRRKQGETQ